jgi:hypothetical protein
MVNFGSWFRVNGSWLLFEHPLSPSPLKGFHLSLYSLSSGEGKIENFENPSFSKFWYRSRSLCPKGRAIGF